MNANLLSWLLATIILGTAIMFGSLGEILTEKSGHLNLGVPGLMALGAFGGFASAWLYEFKNPANLNSFLGIATPFLFAMLASGIGALIYSFFVITLRANQNITGLALTHFGVGVAALGGVYVFGKQGKSSGFAYYSAGLYMKNIFSKMNVKNQVLSDILQIFLSHGFMVYLAIIFAVLMHLFFKKTRVGLNLRAIGENPATADAAGINVIRYKYLSNIIGGMICGLGGCFYVLVKVEGSWSTQGVPEIEALGWLAVALVIFTSWKPLNAIWGAYLFALLYLAWTYSPKVFHYNMSESVKELVRAIPYVTTILVLILNNLRKSRKNQPPAALGLPYFREER